MKHTATDEVTNVPLRESWKHFALKNTGAKTMYLGWESETTADGDTQGYPVDPGEPFAMAGTDIKGGILRVVCAAGESTTYNLTQRG